MILSSTQAQTYRQGRAHKLMIIRLGLLTFGMAAFLIAPETIDMRPLAEDYLAAGRPPDVVVTVDRSKPAGISSLAVGATHTQNSIDSWGDPNAIARGKELLSQAAIYQNQHIMGFGVLNPEPAPGRYDWSGLDRRMQIMRETGAIPTITLCCAPDWMKGGMPGETDWSRLAEAPLPAHYDDFAELARQVALRYPDVKYFLVWNEMKGFWDTKTNNWDYVHYTELYNKVYDALKSVSRDIKVGGPYLVIEGTGTDTGPWGSEKPITKRNREVLSYWLTHKHGADFLALDRSVKSSHDQNSYSQAQYLAFTAIFEDIARQIRTLTDLPIWWVESYFVGSADRPDFEAAGIASMLYHQLKAGSAVSMCWAPQARPLRTSGQHLFTDTLGPGGGQPLPAFFIYKSFTDNFKPGTRLYQAKSSSGDVEVLASATKVLVINKRPHSIVIKVNQMRVTMGVYQVQVLTL